MRITQLETIYLDDYPNILFVGVHTDEGLTGWSDTFYMPQALRGYIHDFAAPMLIGHDPLQIELHWRRLYEVTAHIVGKGAELRALSALDCCLWDIFGQACGRPVWQMLGGGARDRIQTYNTCGGPAYGKSSQGRTGYGTDRGDGRYEDLIAFMTRADELAHDLMSEGIKGMKLWPFDYVAHEPARRGDWRNFKGMFDPALRTIGGHSISADDLNWGLEPFRKIRRAVGDAMNIMVEGHGLWSLPAAKKIARALDHEIKPYWLEDLMRADDIDGLAELQRTVEAPLLVSEYLATRYEYKPVLEKQAAGIIIIDPTWAGGITECRKIAAMAETYKRPVAMHDCTGPFTLMAGLHLAIHCTNAVYQESVRAYLRVTYPDMVTELPGVENGELLAPGKPGIGTQLLPDIRKRPGASVRLS
jgi:galactonate dehydratase